MVDGRVTGAIDEHTTFDSADNRNELPRFRSMELAMIGRAVTELGDRLAQATDARTALTQQLLDIRDEERRSLARELHDEFGQNLTAILAFANTIEATSTQDKANSEVAQDARMISQATHRIIACLRDTLNRLRHLYSGWPAGGRVDPDFAAIGLG